MTTLKVHKAVPRAFMLVVLSCLMLLAAPGAVHGLKADEPLANDARLGGDARQTRFVTVLSKPVKFAVRTLADPYRVIIDLSDVKLNFPSGRGKQGRGLVSGYRYGRVEPFGVRIILDMKSPVLIKDAKILPASDGQPPRLVVEMTRTDRNKFMAELSAQTRKLAARKRETPTQGGAGQAAPRKLKSRNASRVIVIDPGHGGIDPGAVANSGLKEKDVVYAFSLKLRNALMKTGRYDVVMTRMTDTYVPLRKRVDMARRKSADLFISVHADSLSGRYAKSVSGTTVYTLSEDASDEEAKELVTKQNRSDIIAGVELPSESNDVTNILIDLAQRETKNLSISFAETLLAGLSGKTTIHKKGRRFAGFRVLKAPDVPSVLVELGYMTNPEDEKRLKSAQWRSSIATAVARAVDAYFAKRTARNPY